MRCRGRHGSRKNPADMRPCLQQARIAVPAADHTRTHRMGYRPVQDLQGRQSNITREIYTYITHSSFKYNFLWKKQNVNSKYNITGSSSPQAPLVIERW